MKIFHFDEYTGALLSEELARANPLEPGSYLIPKGTTGIAPPVAAEGTVALFDPVAGAWRISEDLRGIWYTAEGAVLSVQEYGPKPPLAVTQEPPPSSLHRYVGEAWVEDAGAKTKHDLALAASTCESALTAISEQYPLAEKLTWPKQEAEARAYTANASAPTPMLSIIALARGLTVADLAPRVILKADAYTILAAQAIGERQKREDEIEAGLAGP